MTTTMLMQLKGINTIVGIFLLIIGVSGNFIAETMSCQIQKVLTNNMYAKNIMLFVIIYFSLDFASTEDHVHPVEIMQRSILIWLFFLIFNKMDLIYSTIIFVVLFYILVIKNYIQYYNKSNEDKELDKIMQKRLELAKNSSEIATVIILLVMAIGFPLYLIKQQKKYKKNFNILTFIFGKTKCRSN